jgi:hypothetical protein
VPFEKDLRPAVDAKAESLRDTGGFDFYNRPHIGGIIGAKPEYRECLA